MSVGLPTVVAIYGNKIAPGLGTGTWGRKDTNRSRRTSLLILTARTTCGSRSRAITARAASSTSAPTASARRRGPI